MIAKKLGVFSAVGLVLVLLLAWAGPALAAEAKVVNVWHTETNAASRKAIDNIIKRFEAKHPGIKVKAEALAWGDLEGKIMASMAAGSPPELSHGQPITCAALQAKGVLLPLDEVVAAIGENNLWDQIKKVGKFGKHYYGLVHAAGTSLLIYRKDLAQKKGLKNPKTWNDLLKAAKALTMDTNGDGKIDIYGVTIPGDNLFINILMGELIAANGGKLFDEKNRPQFTKTQMIQALNFLKELTKYMPPGWEGHGYRETFANMYGGKAAMMFQGYGRGASLIEQYAPKGWASTDYYDVWIKPHGPSGAKPAAQVDEETWMLFKGSKHPKEAIEFLKFFYKDPEYLEYIQSVPIHFFPITKSLRKNPAYLNTPMVKRWKGWLDVQQYYLEKDLAKPTLIIEWSDMNNKPYLMEILGSGILKDMVMEVTKEGVPAEKAAAKAQKRAEELLKMKGYLK
ncbi:MAG: sugar ABC transporter substrate-binding protein [Desulfarculus sp.]|jgi:ABC-type glycerol-3-phosphate transport system substrate-binding protein|nr:MAG: sugar ABC transporter substrate-binding protein [Desulfarculus sp.]